MKHLFTPMAILLAFHLTSCGNSQSPQKSTQGSAAVTDPYATTYGATGAQAQQSCAGGYQDYRYSNGTYVCPNSANAGGAYPNGLPATGVASPMPVAAVGPVLYPVGTVGDPVADLCLAAFAQSGIPVPAGIAMTTLHVGVNVLGFGPGVADTMTTPAPVLTIVKSVSVLSLSRMLLLNRNAFYCFVNTVNVMSHLTVQRACTAQFTGFGVNIDVLSASNFNEGVNVNVLSNVFELPCLP